MGLSQNKAKLWEKIRQCNKQQTPVHTHAHTHSLPHIYRHKHYKHSHTTGAHPHTHMHPHTHKHTRGLYTMRTTNKERRHRGSKTVDKKVLYGARGVGDGVV